MRLVLEILFIGVLMFLGWKQPLRDQVRRTFPQSGVAPSRLAIIALEADYERTQALAPARPGQPGAGPATSRDSRWMWEPGALDPKKK